ncbi:MAG: GTP-binding protein [Desulfobacterales bacterium]|nr:GTP-binding protein [Desulfobacterales bacterium]
MAPDVNLSSFFKGDLDEDPGAGLQAIMRSILIRTQFLPAVRHVIGWRGLKQSAAAVEGWTAKIRGNPGVFGLFFMGAEPLPGWITGIFGLCYFPDPAEALVERYSLRAAAFTQSADYWPCARDFLQHPEMCELFGIGSLLLCVRPDRHGLALVMQSVSSQRTLAREGVRMLRDGQMVELVAAGGCDQDLPAFETALGFFDVLAASVTFNLDQAPDPATQAWYDGSGAVSTQEAPDLWNGLVALGYGAGDFEALCSAVAATERAPLSARTAAGSDSAPGSYQDRLWWRAHQLRDFKSVDKKILGVDDRPPLVILTGFLGSGKTSFLQHFIEYQTQRSRFVAVIQNEIGEIGLDGKLLDYKVTEIDEGCVCCSLVGNLKRAVHGILESFSPDYVILETSGLANPLNLIEEIAGLEDTVRFDCTVTVVDALNFDEALADYRIALDQIRAADVLILNKCDLIDGSRLRFLRQRLHELKPNAPILEATQGDVNPALILDAEESAAEAGERQPPVPTGSTAGPTRRTHRQDGLWSRSLRFTRKLDRGKFLRAAESLPRSIFRAKGIVEIAEPPETMLFQYVAGRYELSAFPQTPTPDRFLTLIGKSDDDGFDRAEQLLRAAET